MNPQSSSSSSSSSSSPSSPPKASGKQSYSLFFALFPDVTTAAHLSALTQQLRTRHGLTGKALDAERFHVSLHWLGDYQGEVPESVLASARQAAAATTAQAFDLAFDQVFTFPMRRDKKPLVLLGKEANPALKAFQRTLGQALKDAGLGQWVTTSFKPHITLLYDSKALPAEPIAPLRWTTQDFVLVRSMLGKSHYDRLHTWPLLAAIP